MKRLIALAVGVGALAVVLWLLVLDGDQDFEPPPPSQAPVPAAVGVDGPDEDAVPDTALPLDREARQIVRNATETPERFDMSGGLRGKDETPVAVQDGPLATPNFPGCTTRILPANWSQRTSSVRAIGLHYTAGGNRPGLSDMNGLTSYASSPSAGVSWHFLIDAEGNCYYSVPLSKKAWTIGNLNSQTVNIEVIGVGNERTYPAGAAGQRKLSSVVQRLGRIYRIPMRVGAVSNCNVTRPGIITHWQGGRCSGGHVDIKPYDLAREVREIAAADKPDPLSPASYNLAVLTKGERSNAECLLFERRVATRNGGWSKVAPSHLERAKRCKGFLLSRNEGLHRLGLTSKYQRAARHRVIHEVV